MFKGKTHAALDLLANNGRGDVLHLDQLVKTDGADESTVKEALS